MENISGILDICIEARVYGIICFGMGLTLREGNREYLHIFENKQSGRQLSLWDIGL